MKLSSLTLIKVPIVILVIASLITLFLWLGFKEKMGDKESRDQGDMAILLSPLEGDGETTSGTVLLEVDMGNKTRSVNKVEFYSDDGNYLIKSVTAAPFTVKWETDPWVPEGEQTLLVKVYHDSNEITELSKTVIIDNRKEITGNYKKVGYYTSWSAYMGYYATDIDANKLTHINYAFAKISTDGKIELGDPKVDVHTQLDGDPDGLPYYGNFYQLNQLKEEYPHIKTLISVGGGLWSERFSDVALTEHSRTVFAESVRDFILTYGFNGVNIDWEYPVAGGEEDNVHRPEDKQNYTLLFQKLRDELDEQGEKDGNEYLVTMAGGAVESFAANTELGLIQDYVDYIEIMAYDFHGEWDSYTGLNAPLFQNAFSRNYFEWSIHDAVVMYLSEGVSPEKVILGLPFYGRTYREVENEDNGVYQDYYGEGTALSYAEIEEVYVNNDEYVRYFEEDSKVPWLFNGIEFISYDDPESIGYKTSYIRENGLGGAMMWELRHDPKSVLLSEVDERLKKKDKTN
ncbi:glycosyl hydrolase family 18 protein [Bacillus coahuilensis]|uniref:glycosyl hydrolase family 18 protein n=1 Tax=Bacillus coahuilensis TaxID=408580 RepID=UPI000750B3E7|nr:glycosyl hydrolase family 18 protein [Bacillus coahuilensis]